MKLTVAVCQSAPCREDVAGNLLRLESMIAACRADLVLLPEMFATGFDPGAQHAAEAPDGPVLETLRHWASRYDRAIAGSIAVDVEGRRYNRMYFVEPSGRTGHYDKRHLFRPGGEAEHYTAGTHSATVCYRGWRLRLLVCYDLRFPVWCRCRDDYDALLCCASWPASRREAWRTLLRARAIENQCYVVGTNRTGADAGTLYAGDSAIIGFRGETLADAGAEECIRTATLDLAAQRAFLEAFPAWRDADPFARYPDDPVR